MSPNPEPLGFAHFLAQSDAISRALLAALVLASIVSWTIIVAKTVTRVLAERRTKRFLDYFWNAQSLTDVERHIEGDHPEEPFSHLAYHAFAASRHHERYGAKRLEEAGSAGEFLTRSIRRVIDEETARLESGLTLLASIGSTAPFVGLFGTVWGIYHALLAIGLSGAGTLDKVAGPVGEALVMTALGLAVAIPAVLGYNFLTRANRLVLSRLDVFAHDVFAFLTTGARIAPDSAPAPAHAPVAPRIVKAGA